MTDTSVCGIEKATYDKCFDHWYKEVFLQQKADGRVGCQEEYRAYSQCFLSELGKSKDLVESIKSVMRPEEQSNLDARLKQEQERRAKLDEESKKAAA